MNGRAGAQARHGPGPDGAFADAPGCLRARLRLSWPWGLPGHPRMQAGPALTPTGTRLWAGTRLRIRAICGIGLAGLSIGRCHAAGGEWQP